MPIYEYECRACGPFSDARPMAASALPAACPFCAAEAPRVLSATAIGLGRSGRGKRRGSAEPTLVTVENRREPTMKMKSRAKSRTDPLKRAAARQGAPDRPWMVGH